MPYDIDLIANVTIPDSVLARNRAKIQRAFQFQNFEASPLGYISRDTAKFEQSLKAAEQRVLAFGATVTIFAGIPRLIQQITKEFIGLDKKLRDINVILNVAPAQLKKFSSDLFTVAKQTGQSFETVSDAALEFSRQGLGVQETLTRTKDAMILARLTGIEVGKAVESLTSIVNTFENEVLSSTDALNKMAAVDAAYAVSSKDLSDALARTSSSAQDAKVSFDELLAAVTAVKQRTGITASTIGQAFKTIFARIQRPEALGQLEEIGIAVRNFSGETLPAMEILKQLANRLDSLSDTEKSTVKEIVGGIRQLNILSALLRDLSKDYGIYEGALRKASGATDEAIARNALLAESFSSQINVTKQVLKEFGALVGELAIKPSLDRILGIGKTIGGLGNLGTQGEDFGQKFGKGILRGIGEAIAGPGLTLGAFGLLKILKQISGSAIGSFKGLIFKDLGRANTEQAIANLLRDQVSKGNIIIGQGLTREQREQAVLGIIRQQTAELQRQQSINASFVTAIKKAGFVGAEGGYGFVKKNKAAGYIPPVIEQKEKSEAYAHGYSPGAVTTFNHERLGPVVVNRAERLGTAPNGETAIITPKMIASGVPEMFNIRNIRPIMASGYIPNYSNPVAGIPQKPAQSKKLLIEIAKKANLEKEVYYALTHDGFLPKDLRERLSETAKTMDLPQSYQKRISRTASGYIPNFGKLENIAGGRIPNFGIKAFHGTSKNFNIFRKGDIGFHFGTAKTVEDLLRLRIGRPFPYSNEAVEERTKGQRSIPVLLNITNPLRMDDVLHTNPIIIANRLFTKGIITSKEYENISKHYKHDMGSKFSYSQFAPLRKLLKNKGYDGIVYKNEYEGKGDDSYIAFYPNQIKSIFNQNPNYRRRAINAASGFPPQLNKGHIPNYASKLPLKDFNPFFHDIKQLSKLTGISAAELGQDPYLTETITRNFANYDMYTRLGEAKQIWPKPTKNFEGGGYVPNFNIADVLKQIGESRSYDYGATNQVLKEFYGGRASGYVPNYATWITPTKKILKQLEKEEIYTARLGTEASYNPFLSLIRIPKARPGFDVSLVNPTDSPLFALWHEAGHAFTMPRDKHLEEYLKKVKNNVKYNAANERLANIEILSRIKKWGAPDNIVEKFIDYANRHYQTYIPKSFSNRKMFGIPSNAFAGGEFDPKETAKTLATRQLSNTLGIKGSVTMVGSGLAKNYYEIWGNGKKLDSIYYDRNDYSGLSKREIEQRLKRKWLENKYIKMQSSAGKQNLSEGYIPNYSNILTPAQALKSIITDLHGNQPNPLIQSVKFIPAGTKQLRDKVFRMQLLNKNVNFSPEDIEDLAKIGVPTTRNVLFSPRAVQDRALDVNSQRYLDFLASRRGFFGAQRDEYEKLIPFFELLATKGERYHNFYLNNLMELSQSGIKYSVKNPNFGQIRHYPQTKELQEAFGDTSSIISIPDMAMYLRGMGLAQGYIPNFGKLENIAGGRIPNFANWITPTKELLKLLGREGVHYNRWGDASKYTPLTNEIQIPTRRRATAFTGNPVFDLFHEAGHWRAITEGRVMPSGGPIRDIANWRLKVQQKAKSERFANTAALELMNELEMPKTQITKFKKFAQKHYNGYRRNPWNPNPRARYLDFIPSSPFQLGEIEDLYASGFLPNIAKGWVPNFSEYWFLPNKQKPILADRELGESFYMGHGKAAEKYLENEFTKITGIDALDLGGISEEEMIKKYGKSYLFKAGRKLKKSGIRQNLREYIDLFSGGRSENDFVRYVINKRQWIRVRNGHIEMDDLTPKNLETVRDSLSHFKYPDSFLGKKTNIEISGPNALKRLYYENVPLEILQFGNVGDVKEFRQRFASGFLPQLNKGYIPNYAENIPKIIAYHLSKVPSPNFDNRFRTDLSSMGFHFGTEEQAKFRAGQYDFNSKTPTLGKYALAIKKPLEVSHMASFAPDYLADKMMDLGLLTENQYAKIRSNSMLSEPQVGTKLIKILKKAGYDGLKYSNEREGQGYSYVPFNANQIEKLAQGYIPNYTTYLHGTSLENIPSILERGLMGKGFRGRTFSPLFYDTFNRQQGMFVSKAFRGSKNTLIHRLSANHRAYSDKSQEAVVVLNIPKDYMAGFSEKDHQAIGGYVLAGSKIPREFIKRVLVRGDDYRWRTHRASGYIPNFAITPTVGVPNFSALQDAIGRESMALSKMFNITPSYAKGFVRVGRDSRAASGINPSGLAVYNTLQGQTSAQGAINQHQLSGDYRNLPQKGMAGGFLPNFATSFSTVSKKARNVIEAAGLETLFDMKKEDLIVAAQIRGILGVTSKTPNKEIIEKIADKLIAETPSIRTGNVFSRERLRTAIRTQKQAKGFKPRTISSLVPTSKETVLAGSPVGFRATYSTPAQTPVLTAEIPSSVDIINEKYKIPPSVSSIEAGTEGNVTNTGIFSQQEILNRRFGPMPSERFKNRRLRAETNPVTPEEISSRYWRRSFDRKLYEGRSQTTAQENQAKYFQLLGQNLNKINLTPSAYFKIRSFGKDMDGAISHLIETKVAKTREEAVRILADVEKAGPQTKTEFQKLRKLAGGSGLIGEKVDNAFKNIMVHNVGLKLQNITTGTGKTGLDITEKQLYYEKLKKGNIEKYGGGLTEEELQNAKTPEQKQLRNLISQVTAKEFRQDITNPIAIAKHRDINDIRGTTWNVFGKQFEFGRNEAQLREINKRLSVKSISAVEREALESQQMGMKEKIRARKQGLLFGGAFAVSAVGGLASELVGGQNTQLGRTVGGIGVGASTGMQVAALIPRFGVAVGVGIGALMTFKSVMDNLTPSIEDLARKSQELSGKQQAQIEAFGQASQIRESIRELEAGGQGQGRSAALLRKREQQFVSQIGPNPKLIKALYANTPVEREEILAQVQLENQRIETAANTRVVLKQIEGENESRLGVTSENLELSPFLRFFATGKGRYATLGLSGALLQPKEANLEQQKRAGDLLISGGYGYDRKTREVISGKALEEKQTKIQEAIQNKDAGALTQLLREMGTNGDVIEAFGENIKLLGNAAEEAGDKHLQTTLIMERVKKEQQQLGATITGFGKNLIEANKNITLANLRKFSAQDLGIKVSEGALSVVEPRLATGTALDISAELQSRRVQLGAEQQRMENNQNYRGLSETIVRRLKSTSVAQPNKEEIEGQINTILQGGDAKTATEKLFALLNESVKEQDVAGLQENAQLTKQMMDLATTSEAIEINTQKQLDEIKLQTEIQKLIAQEGRMTSYMGGINILKDKKSIDWTDQNKAFKENIESVKNLFSPEGKAKTTREQQEIAYQKRVNPTKAADLIAQRDSRISEIMRKRGLAAMKDRDLGRFVNRDVAGDLVDAGRQDIANELYAVDKGRSDQAQEAIRRKQTEEEKRRILKDIKSFREDAPQVRGMNVKRNIDEVENLIKEGKFDEARSRVIRFREQATTEEDKNKFGVLQNSISRGVATQVLSDKSAQISAERYFQTGDQKSFSDLEKRLSQKFVSSIISGNKEEAANNAIISTATSAKGIYDILKSGGTTGVNKPDDKTPEKPTSPNQQTPPVGTPATSTPAGTPQKLPWTKEEKTAAYQKYKEKMAGFAPPELPEGLKGKPYGILNKYTPEEMGLFNQYQDDVKKYRADLPGKQKAAWAEAQKEVLAARTTVQTPATPQPTPTAPTTQEEEKVKEKAKPKTPPPPPLPITELDEAKTSLTGIGAIANTAKQVKHIREAATAVKTAEELTKANTVTKSVVDAAKAGKVVAPAVTNQARAAAQLEKSLGAVAPKAATGLAKAFPTVVKGASMVGKGIMGVGRGFANVAKFGGKWLGPAAQIAGLGLDAYDMFTNKNYFSDMERVNTEAGYGEAFLYNLGRPLGAPIDVARQTWKTGKELNNLFDNKREEKKLRSLADLSKQMKEFLNRVRETVKNNNFTDNRRDFINEQIQGFATSFGSYGDTGVYQAMVKQLEKLKEVTPPISSQTPQKITPTSPVITPTSPVITPTSPVATPEASMLNRGNQAWFTPGGIIDQSLASKKLTLLYEQRKELTKQEEEAHDAFRLADEYYSFTGPSQFPDVVKESMKAVKDHRTKTAIQALGAKEAGGILDKDISTQAIIDSVMSGPFLPKRNNRRDTGITYSVNGQMRRYEDTGIYDRTGRRINKETEDNAGWEAISNSIAELNANLTQLVEGLQQDKESQSGEAATSTTGSFSVDGNVTVNANVTSESSQEDFQQFISDLKAELQAQIDQFKAALSEQAGIKLAIPPKNNQKSQVELTNNAQTQGLQL